MRRWDRARGRYNPLQSTPHVCALVLGGAAKAVSAAVVQRIASAAAAVFASAWRSTQHASTRTSPCKNTPHKSTDTSRPRARAFCPVRRRCTTRCVLQGWRLARRKPAPAGECKPGATAVQLPSSLIPHPNNTAGVGAAAGCAGAQGSRYQQGGGGRDRLHKGATGVKVTARAVCLLGCCCCCCCCCCCVWMVEPSCQPQLHCHTTMCDQHIESTHSTDPMHQTHTTTTTTATPNNHHHRRAPAWGAPWSRARWRRGC